MKNKSISPLISAEELQHILGKENLKVFDVRGIWGTQPHSQYEEYKKGHIPTAVFLDWTKEFLEQNIDVNLEKLLLYSSLSISLRLSDARRFSSRSLYSIHFLINCFLF